MTSCITNIKILIWQQVFWCGLWICVAEQHFSWDIASERGTSSRYRVRPGTTFTGRVTSQSAARSMWFADYPKSCPHSVCVYNCRVTWHVLTLYPAIQLFRCKYVTIKLSCWVELSTSCTTWLPGRRGLWTVRVPIRMVALVVMSITATSHGTSYVLQDVMQLVRSAWWADRGSSSPHSLRVPVLVVLKCNHCNTDVWLRTSDWQSFPFPPLSRPFLLSPSSPPIIPIPFLLFPPFPPPAGPDRTHCHSFIE